jgi:hypothetical protein
MGNRYLKELLIFNLQILKKIFYTNVETAQHLFYHHPNGQECNGISFSTKVDFQQISKAVLTNSTKRKFTFAKNIAVMTYNNSKEKSILEQCYDNYQINDYIVVAKSYHPWNWLGKIKPIYDFLISEKAKRFDYVLSTDANDVLLINNPDDIIERFEY